MYDILVLVVEQKGPVEFGCEEILTKAVNQCGSDRRKFYHSAWPFINNLNGILYKVFTSGDLGEYECGDELFDFDYSFRMSLDDMNLLSLSWQENDRICEEISKITLKMDYRQAFFEFIEAAIDASPIRTILFLCNDQSFKQDLIRGVLKESQFQQLLSLGNIFTNVCYIISG